MKHSARAQIAPHRWGWSDLRLTTTTTTNGTAAITLAIFGGKVRLQLTHDAAVMLADRLVDLVEQTTVPDLTATHIHE